jgi:hypothetical protein
VDIVGGALVIATDGLMRLELLDASQNATFSDLKLKGFMNQADEKEDEFWNSLDFR